MESAQRFRLPVNRLALVCGLAIFVIGLVLRAIGIGWGLPNEMRTTSLHPDEPIIWMYSQRIEPAKGQFVPGFYNYGTLYLTLLRVTTDVATAYGAGPKAADGSDRDAAVGRFILAGRWLSALAGAGIGWVVFLMLYRRTHVIGAVAAGLATAFAPGMVVHSRFQTVDVLAAFFLTLSLLYSLKLATIPGSELPDDRTLMKWAGLAGLFAGLSAGTKYTGILALIALYVVAVGAWRRRGELSGPWLKLIGIGTGMAVAAFLVTTPGAVLDSVAFMRDFKYEMTHTSTGHGLVFAATSSGFIYHIANLLIAYGLLMVPFSLVGIGRAVYRRHLWMIALVAFGLAYYILIGRAEVKFLRYVFPLIPILAVGFGWLIGQAHDHPRRGWRIVVVLGIISFAGFIASRTGYGGGITGSALLTIQMAQEDVRDEVGRWMKQEAGTSQTVGLVSDPWFYTPTLYPQASLPLAVPIDIREEIRRATTHPPVVRYIPPEGIEARFDWDDRLLTEDRPDWVVVSSFEVDDLERISKEATASKEFQGQVDRYRRFVSLLEKEYTQLRVVGWDGPKVHDLMYIRPTLWVWKRKSPTDMTKESNGSSTTSAPSEGPAPTR